MTNQQYGGYPGPQYGPPPQQQYGQPAFGPPAYPPAPPPPVYGGQPGQQGFAWGPQFGPPGHGFVPQPPKKKRGAGPLLAVFGILGALVIGVVVLAAVASQKDDDPTVVHRPQSTVPTAPTVPTVPSDSPTVGGSPSLPTISTLPTITRPTTRPTPRVTTPNDRQVVTRDKFYFSGLHRGVNCRESNARATNLNSALAYYGNVKLCLDRAWPEHLRRAGDPFRKPKLIAFAGSAYSPCSGNAPSAFYCGLNETIYMDAGSDIQNYRKFQNYSNRSQAMAWLRAGMTDTTAHEYGHHLQHLTGILDASWAIARRQPTRAGYLEISRRKEIQASCFGWVFLGANQNSYGLRSGRLRKELDYLTSHSGDEYGTERDHGSRFIQPYWFKRGFNSRNLAMCNTYVASASTVR